MRWLACSRSPRETLLKAQRSKVPARWREYYHDLLRWPSLLNAWRWWFQLRTIGRSFPTPALVNLGCGKDYRYGYINIDVNLAYRRDMWLHLSNPLPLRSNSVDGIFCSHVLEHFAFAESNAIVRECYRILKPGAVLRVGVPDFVPAIEAYQSGDRNYFHSTGNSLGRLLCDHVLDNSNHKLMFDYTFLEELLVNSGFDTVRQCNFRQGTLPLSEKMSELDNREDITVFAEAQKKLIRTNRSL